MPSFLFMSQIPEFKLFAKLKTIIFVILILNIHIFILSKQFKQLHIIL